MSECGRDSSETVERRRQSLRMRGHCLTEASMAKASRHIEVMCSSWICGTKQTMISTTLCSTTKKSSPETTTVSLEVNVLPRYTQMPSRRRSKVMREQG